MIIYSYCVIDLRATAATEEYKRLGRTLERWDKGYFNSEGCTHWVMPGSLSDLLAGEPPKPALLQVTEHMRHLNEEGKKGKHAHMLEPDGLEAVKRSGRHERRIIMLTTHSPACSNERFKCGYTEAIGNLMTASAKKGLIENFTIVELSPPGYDSPYAYRLKRLGIL